MSFYSVAPSYLSDQSLWKDSVTAIFFVVGIYSAFLPRVHCGLNSFWPLDLGCLVFYPKVHKIHQGKRHAVLSFHMALCPSTWNWVIMAVRTKAETQEPQ